MTRPSQHPKTGIYRVRVAIPAPLRDLAKQQLGVSRELVENLRTKDPAEARKRVCFGVQICPPELGDRRPKWTP